MAVTNEVELSPQGAPRSQNPHQMDGNYKKKEISVALNVIGTGQQTAEGTCSKISEEQKMSKTTEEMTGFMDDLALSSPKERSQPCSRSSSSRRSSSVSSSDSSYSSSSSSSVSSSSTCWSRSRSRSRSHAKRICSRRSRYSRSYSRSHSRSYSRSHSRSYSRSHSRSYSRSRSRSHNYRYRGRSHLRYYRRHPRSRPMYQSRSRSPIRSYYRRSYFRSKSRSRGYYGFGRTVCPEAYRRWRNCSRSRSRSRTPLRLSEKEKRELLEIAKANAAKTFGKEIVLPASLKIDSKASENGNPKENLDFKTNRQTEEKRGIEMTSVTRGITLSPNNIMPRPLALKSAGLLSKNPVASPTREEKKGSVGQWIPVKNEENVLFHNFSPKSTAFRAR